MRMLTLLLCTLVVVSVKGQEIYANQLAGATPGAQINTALAACASYTGSSGNSCVIVLPVGMGCGEGNQAPDNVLILDYRNCDNSQGLRFNLSLASATNVRSKMYLQDNFHADTVGLAPTHNSSTNYTLSYVDNPNATTGSIEAVNGSQAINTITGNYNGTLVGVEGEAFCNASNAAWTAADCRGGTFNALAGGSTSVTQLKSLEAQGVQNSGTGLVANAFSLKVDAPTNTGGGSITNSTLLSIADAGSVATGSNLSLVSAGPSEFDKTVGVGAGPQGNYGILLRSSNLSGGSQYGVAVAPITTSGATTSADGLTARADTAAAVFTQALNIGIESQTPSLGTGSSVTEWNGIRVDSAPAAGTACSLKLMGATSGSVCINPTAGSGTASFVYPAGASTAVMMASFVTTAAATNNVTITGMTSSGHCSLSATNSGAAGDLANTYISGKTTNQITVTHSAVAGHTYDILCTAT